MAYIKQLPGVRSSVSQPPRILVLGADEEAGRSLLKTIESLSCSICTTIEEGWPLEPVSAADEFTGAVMLGGALAMMLTGILSTQQAYSSIGWKSVFLVAGMLPMGIALTKTN